MPSPPHSDTQILPWPANDARWWQWLLAALGFVALHAALGRAGFFHWLIVDGAVFTAMWCLPVRRWPWLFAATIAARLVGGALVGIAAGARYEFLRYWHGPVPFVLGNAAEPFLIAAGVLYLRQVRLSPRGPATPERMAQLHVGALIAALAVAAKDLAYVASEGMVGDVRSGLVVDMVPIGGPDSLELLATFALKNLMGCFVGIMLVAPFALWLASPARRAGSARILRAALRWLLPAMAAYLLLSLRLPGSLLSEMLRLLLLTAVVVFAMQHGWRGAALAVLAASMAVAIEDHFGIRASNPIRLQLYIAISGAMGLLFGASMDSLRSQAAELQSAMDHGNRLARELSNAAERTLQAEERERRRLAAELHDEFGQNLTALQTRLKLAEPELVAAGRQAGTDGLFDIARTMRQNIGRVLESLRPAALDEIGLYAAIERGSVRHLAEDAGLEFETRIEGDARLLALLGGAQRIAAYRLVREAVPNVVRHARATRCSIRLRINRRHGDLYVFIDVRDDGIGGARHLRPGNGLSSMHDRVLALGGRLHLQDLAPGLRVHALLRDERAPSFR
ncbi:hypothetical protein CSC71_07470 [Pseudoxanthomonas sangjuensis]|uniref:histidine kinase n=1 Tax=Pseudoxanthomonas sangjuensis TaxID=1503750 RepID=UPI001390DB1F|nr:histidine kinase [Pseudoxanthomonas sangjuensis]KAF1713512.1 hypothetical protein CSC71_07470 [Pseudoxanthomonas sangjuensis]